MSNSSKSYEKKSLNAVTRVLIVDDSAYVRKVIRQILSRSPFIEVVGSARNGLEALALVEELQPDVVTLDLNMPEMDGLEFLRHQMARRPLPVVVVSVASESGELALAALDAGAVDFVQKPTALATEKIYQVAEDLIQKVKAAAQAAYVPKFEVVPPAPSPRPSVRWRGGVDLVAIGVSTGGPQALKHLIPQLPPDLPVPVVIVLHMPVGFTAMYAQKLNEISQLQVVEAGEGELIRPGVVYLAPAGKHLILVSDGVGMVRTNLSLDPAELPHRPSVDVLFRSAAQIYQQRLLAVIMTGMGNDGLEGAAWVKAQGGLVFTEAEESCVIYGMPRVVVEANLSDRCVPLSHLAQSILEVV